MQTCYPARWRMAFWLRLLVIPICLAVSACNGGLSESATEPVQATDSAEDSAAQLRAAANAGDATAMTRLGQRFEDGEDGPVDIEQARDWYRLAADAGDPRAEYLLGRLHYRGALGPRNPARAAEHFLAAAEQGDAEAHAALAHLFEVGDGVPQDFARAREFYALASLQPESSSATWYRKAARLGVAETQYFLGLSYEFGEGVEPDIERARHWYQLSADKGHTLALQRMGKLDQVPDLASQNDSKLTVGTVPGAVGGGSDAAARVEVEMETGNAHVVLADPTDAVRANVAEGQTDGDAATETPSDMSSDKLAQGSDAPAPGQDAAQTSPVDAVPIEDSDTGTVSAAPQTQAPQPAATNAPSGGREDEFYFAHLASYENEGGLTRGWEMLSARHSEILGRMVPKFAAVQVPDRGIFYRLVTGPFKGYSEAQAFCDGLTSVGAFCQPMLARE